MSNFKMQGCAVAEPGGPWCPTFALRWLGNLSFFCTNHNMLGTIKFRGSEVQSTGLPSFFVEHRIEKWFLIFVILTNFAYMGVTIHVCYYQTILQM